MTKGFAAVFSAMLMLLAFSADAAQMPARRSVGAELSAIWCFDNAQMMLAAYEAPDEDAVSKIVASQGFVHRGNSWERIAADGTVDITAVFDQHLFFVKFTPAHRAPIPSGMLTNLATAATRTKLSPPDAMLYKFENEMETTEGHAAASVFESWVLVSSSDGAWMNTTTFISYK